MFQALLRNYLLNRARQSMRDAAQHAAAGAAESFTQPTGTEQPSGEPIEPRREVCHVGLVFALGIEAGGLIDRLSGVIQTSGAGFSAREGGLQGRRLVVVESGVGRVKAAHTTEALILGHQPRWVISAGFAGGLDQRLALGDILMADEIIDTEGKSLSIDFKLDAAARAPLPHLHVGRLLTGDQILHGPQEKSHWARQTGALAVDMESSAVASVCQQEKVRFLSVRVISDTADRQLPRDIDRLLNKTTTAGHLGAAAGAIFRRPGSLKDMWQLKEDALVASDRLARFLTGVIGQLP